MKDNPTHRRQSTAGADKTSMPRESRRSLWAVQHRLAPYFFVLPFVFVFCAFFLYPLIRSISLSFCTTSGPGLIRYVGLSHYRFLLMDWLFWLAAINTAVYAAIFLSLEIPLSLALAMLLSHPAVHGRNWFRLAFFSGNLVGQVFVAMIFSLLLAPRQGLVNRAAAWLLPGGVETDWRGDPRYAMAALILASLWLFTGYAMVLYLAALGAIEPHLLEAAEVDGASAWSRFWHVTVPGVRPVTVFLILIGTIGALSLFELPFVLFQGPGPRFTAFTLVEYLYAQGFEAGDLGMASAVAWVLVFLILIVTLVQIRITRAAGEE